MSRLIEYAEASPEARAVFEDIKATRGVADVNNFWKALAVHPPTLARVWESLKQVMAPGALDPLVKEMLYLAASAAAPAEDWAKATGGAEPREGLLRITQQEAFSPIYVQVALDIKSSS